MLFLAFNVCWIIFNLNKIDFGIKINRYYNRYEYGQHPSSIEEIIQANLLPLEDDIPINNLYINGLNSEKVDRSNLSNLDGILISHPHKDHYFGLSFVNRTIPIYIGVVTKRIIRAFCKSERLTIANNFKACRIL